MIKLDNVSLQRGAKLLLNHTQLSIFPGQKVGLIGANGSGKTTFFKLLLGQLQCDSGSCQIPANWRVAHMAQEVASHSATALDYVLDGDVEYQQLQQALASGEHEGEALAALFNRMDEIDGYTAEARAQQLLYGLGFLPEDAQKPVASFSGGWRIRLNLAQALMCRSDLLLLDEPTNHLDMDATLWLEARLQRYPGTLVIISHDRDFLDNVVNSVISIEQQQLVTYSGNYTAFERQRAERLLQQQQAFEKQQARIADIENFVRRFRAKASKARQAQSRLKELERMEQLAPAHLDSPFTFRIPHAEKTSTPLLTLSDAELGYGSSEKQTQTSLLQHINFNVFPGARIGLLGANGAGKSTLIKTLAGGLPLLSGQRITGEHLSLGYFAQHQLDALDLQASAVLHLQRLSTQMQAAQIQQQATEQVIRNYLGSFGFMGDRAFETIAHFSGGEKARLALALICWQKPNLLLLDEPTNHLDLEMRHALTMALQTFEGAVILVSHDRHLLRNSVDEFLLVDSGALQPYDGDLNDYAKALSTRQRQTVEKPATSNNKQAASPKKSGSLKQQNQLQKQLSSIEKKIAALETRLTELETRLTDFAADFSTNATNLTSPEYQTLVSEQQQARQQLTALEEEWLMASEKLESLTV